LVFSSDNINALRVQKGIKDKPKLVVRKFWSGVQAVPGLREDEEVQCQLSAGYWNFGIQTKSNISDALNALYLTLDALGFVRFRFHFHA